MTRKSARPSRVANDPTLAATTSGLKARVLNLFSVGVPPTVSITLRWTFFYAWSCDCGFLTVDFRECHGAYSDQTHIKGEEPSKGGDFYGISEGYSSECKVEFEC